MRRDTKIRVDSYFRKTAKYLSIFPGGLAGNLTQAILEMYLLRQGIDNEELDRKMAKLSESLNESSKLMTEIEVAFKGREEQVEKLKKEAKQAKIIKEFNKDDVDAFVEIIDWRLKHAGLITTFWSAVFCLVGLVGGYLITRYLIPIQ